MGILLGWMGSRGVAVAVVVAVVVMKGRVLDLRGGLGGLVP